MKTKSQIGRAARRKGAEFERFVVRFIQARLPVGFTARRRLQSRGGWREPDVGIFRDGDPHPLWHIECKCGKKPSMKNAIRQAIAQAHPAAFVACVVKNTIEHKTECVRLISERLQQVPCSLDELADEIARWCIVEQ